MGLLRTGRPLTPDDRGLLDRLVRTCGPRLLAYVRHAYRGHVDAEEIVAETFCRAAARIEMLRSCRRPDLYLLTVARNLCRDWFRHAPEQNVADAALDRPTSAAEPHDQAVSAENRQALLAAMAELPDAQREVLALRLSTSLKFEEIAELLNVPLGTVLSRMHAAVERLRTMFGCAHES
jgi:RNA polymerase sigma-70 factor (ECF subfamily)